MKRFFRRTGVGAFGLALISASLGCSTPPPPPKVLPKPPVVVAAPPPPPPLPPAKWMQVAGATLVGPQIDGGTLMLVGGRRVLVAADGSMKSETAPSPEPLQQVIVVPIAGGGKRIIARSNNGIYRLDDPLGAPKPLAQSESEIRSIAAYVGLVAVWTYSSDLARLVDIDTGKFKLVTTLPPLPMRTVAFRNDKDGAAIFDGVGLATTNDGGTTWKRVSEEVNGDAMRMQGLLVRGGGLRAYVYEDGMESPIDTAQAKLGRAEDPPSETSAPAMVRWVRTTRTDPIAAAVSSGVEVGEGSAIVATNGLLARVDMRTGTITAVEEFGHDVGNGSCNFQRAGAYGWLACPIAEQPNSDVYDPYGIMRVSLDGTNIKPERPAIVHSGEVEMRTSPSGGVMILAPCTTSDSESEVCARQPDGRWVSLNNEFELSSRAVGPLSDGRVAFLRNMYDGDKPEMHVAGDEGEEEAARPDTEENEESGEEREDRFIPEGKRLYVAAIGEGRKEERIATLMWRAHGDIRVQSPIQEDADHNLHFILADDDGLYSVVQPIDKEARIPQRLEGMTEARLRGSRGIAAGNESIRATTDGGRTWTGVPMPTRARDALSQIDSFSTDPGLFSVSDVGVLLDKTVRIGWGATDNFEEPIEPVFDSVLPSVSRVSAPERTLSCSVETNIQGTPPLSGTAMTAALLGKKTPAPKGTRRSAAATSTTRDGVMGVIANFDEEGPDKPGSVPAKWTLSWFDPVELGGKPRTWSGAPPKDTPWGAQLRATWGTGARALFSLRVNGKSLLIRTKGAGVETVEVASDLVPSSDVTFGSDKGEPIAWFRDNSLIIWISGEAPRVIGQVSYRSNRLLGEPTKDGVPVLLSTQDWSAVRVFPIPAMDKKGPPPAALAPTLDGWTAAPNLVNHVGRFNVCTAKPKGAMHFSVPRSYARATVDGATGSLGSAHFEVFMNGADACVAQLGALYSADRSSSRSTPPSNPKGPKKATIMFVRADFIGKRAEGGTRGLPAKDAMNKLTCTLEERK